MTFTRSGESSSTNSQTESSSCFNSGNIGSERDSLPSWWAVFGLVTRMVPFSQFTSSQVAGTVRQVQLAYSSLARDVAHDQRAGEPLPLAAANGYGVADGRLPDTISGPGKRAGRAREHPLARVAIRLRERLFHGLLLLEPIPATASHATHTASKLHDGILPTSIGPSHHSTAGCLYPVSQRFAAIRKCHRRSSFPTPTVKSRSPGASLDQSHVAERDIDARYHDQHQNSRAEHAEYN